MSTETLNQESVLNLAEAMTNLDGDWELLQEIMDIFLDTAQDQLQVIEDGIAAGESKQVAVQSHGMKGGASNFCAKRFVAAALSLEVAAKSESLDGANDMLSEMRVAFAELKELAEVINWDEVQRNWQG